MVRPRMFMVLPVMVVLALILVACEFGVVQTSPNVGSECITDADCYEGLHCCKDDLCHECCEDYDCDEDAGESCSVEYKCVEKEEPAVEPQPEPEEEKATHTPTPTATPTVTPTATPTALPAEEPAPPPDADRVAPHVLEEFEEDYNAAFDTGDPLALWTLMHPEANRIFGEKQCQEYAREVIDNHVNIEILSAGEIGTWRWVIDGLSIDIENVIKVALNFATQDGVTQQEPHLGLLGDGSLLFFPRCGEPLPTTPEQEPRVEPAPPLVLTAPEGVGRNCETGELTGAPEPWVKLIAVEVTADTVSWQMGQISQFPIAVGMQGYLPGYPLIEESPWDWFFDTRGHFNLGGMCESPDECSGSLGVVVGGREGDWTVVPGVQPAVWIEDDKLWMDVQWDQIVQELLPYYPVDDPSTITIMFTATDGIECDAVGEGADGLPTVLLIELPFSEQP